MYIWSNLIALFYFNQNSGTFVEWRPLGGINAEVEYEIHGKIEYGVVTTQEPESSIDIFLSSIKIKPNAYFFK